MPRGEKAEEPAAFAGLIEKAGLGGTVTFAVADAETGEFIERYNHGARLAPASVAKAATAYYALERLGPGFRYETRLRATGPITKGRIDGDLVLEGTGDPTFDSDDLGDMFKALKEAGVREVAGTFRLKPDALPALPWIDPDQPVQVAYNPAISGLNLNFNRVHFEWTKAKEGYDITMQARAIRYRPAVSIATMALEDRRTPVYTYEKGPNADQWTVAERALGNNGARWLPISRPEAYVRDVSLTIARSHGIVLKSGPNVVGPATGEVLVTHLSQPLNDMLTGMLRYSTNLTAEAVGLTASIAGGARPASLIRSAREMNGWLGDVCGTRTTGFVDHSGLGYGSRVGAEDMVQILLNARQRGDRLKALLRDFRSDVPGVKAKTGTLNFVSGLAGYIEVPRGRDLVFAIFTGDLARRDAVEVAMRERPPGSRPWARRSRALQQDLIARWASLAA
ncbi:MAG: D-alanyl-D-alanine carboxypeptidase/D-alanyl-D-alanine-endopeptidase [Pseudomonadota bacterium]